MVPPKEILEKGHWSKPTAFEKFYHKLFLKCDKNFQQNVFGELWREVVQERNFSFMQDRVYHQYYVWQIFYDMKFRIKPGIFSSLQGN